TEFGPPGSWESPKNKFGMAIELTSTQKADRYRRTWESTVAKERDHLALGGYAFQWGAKQETTATWFGTFLPDGSRLGAVDALAELWTGKLLANHCPIISDLKLVESHDAQPGATVHATLAASDPDGDPITVRWVLQAEQQNFGLGGDAEAAPPAFP